MRAFLLCVLLAAVGLAAAKTKWNQLDNYDFNKYIEEFKKHYTPSEFTLRKATFERRLAAIRAHNSNPSFTWKEGVNQFTDRTEEEYSRMLGYDSRRGMAMMPNKVRSAPAGIMDERDLPASVDWRNHSPNIITAVKNQGACGSCWTFGTTETIESFYALAGGPLTVFSEQQMLDCTPNPNDCGGTGGCGGGTAELAMDRVKVMGGLTTEAHYPYLSGGGQNFACHFNNKTTPPVATLAGYVNLPVNQYLPVLTALANVGPLIINVDASAWSGYDSGVFNGCNQANPDIDHVVQLVGYGTDASAGDYWLVRNSWTAGWGENGYIRIARSSALECGTDTNPQDGTGCNGGPPTVKVCGTCGILFDALYPVLSNSTEF